MDDKKVDWVLYEVPDLVDLLAAEISDGTDVYSSFLSERQARSLGARRTAAAYSSPHR